MKHSTNNRTQRIRRFVAASNRPVTHDEIVAMLRRDPADAELKGLGNKVAALLCQLTGHKKLKRTGAAFDYRYEATPTTLVDGRSKSIARTPPSQATQQTPPAPSQPSRTSERTPPFVVPNANLTRPRASALDSAQIAADIAAFEARGGCIQRFRPGESSQSIREQHDAYIATRGQGAARPRASARIAIKARASNDETLDADDQVDVA